MTFNDFYEVFTILAMQLRATDASEAQALTYYELLKTFDLSLVMEAATRLARTSLWFPKTSEWIEEINLARKAALRKALPSPRADPWHYDCTACADTGWEEFACPAQPCERTREHAPHSYARICPCRPTNRTYRRHHALRKGDPD